MSDFFTLTVLVAVVGSGVRLATPYLLAGLGETVGQKSGVLNLGIDGVMQLSAFSAYFVVLKTDNLMLGVLAGLAVGAVMGVFYGVITIVFKATQGISGIGIFIFGLGFSDLLFQRLVGTPKPIRQLPTIEIPFLSELPVVGEALFQHNPLTYVAFILVPVTILFLGKTTFGLNIRAVGENPHAADSLGVSVERTRYVAILIGNTMAGLAGVALVLELGIFQPNLTQGLGFIAVALVYFGSWRPSHVMAGALLYGLVNATVLQLKARNIIPLSFSELAAMAPAVLTIVALVILAQRVKGPAALTKPFIRH
ncbi:MAG: ABC transporter permease [Actinobacteria bacterium]|nr:ABC transporter permease [Actinomycetota bacterium]